MARIGGIHQEFAEDDRLAVGEGNRGTAILSGEFGHALRRSVLGGNLLWARLGDLPVLAEFAIDVAPGRAQREGSRSRKIVEERLLFDGVDMRGGNPRVDERVVCSAAILAHAAVAALHVSHGAFARTQLALDLAIIEFLIELRFDDVARVVFTR